MFKSNRNLDKKNKNHKVNFNRKKKFKIYSFKHQNNI